MARAQPDHERQERHIYDHSCQGCFPRPGPVVSLSAMKVNVLALDGVFDLGLAAVLDALQTANELIEVGGLAVPRFEVRIAGVRKSVKTSQGLTVPVHAAPWRSPDCVVVPAIGYKMPGPLQAALARPDIREAGAALLQWDRRGAML